jgi:hypothetical protein
MTRRKSWEDEPAPTANGRDLRKWQRDNPGKRVLDQQPVRSVRLARVPDQDACPSGYDPYVWDMTILFDQLAEKHDVQLALGRPMIYAKLLRRMEELRDTLADRDRRGMPWKHNGLPMPRGVWSIDGVTRVDTWQRLGRAAIRYEWKTYDQDTYAVDWFCGRVRFWEMISEVRARGYFRYCAIQLAKKEFPEMPLELELDAMARREERRTAMRQRPRPAPVEPEITYEAWTAKRASFVTWSQAWKDSRGHR